MELVIFLGGGAAALLAVLNLCRVVYRSWKRVDDFLDDWNGTNRVGHDPVPSMPERMSRVEARLKCVEDHIKGGTA